MPGLGQRIKAEARRAQSRFQFIARLIFSLHETGNLVFRDGLRCFGNRGYLLDPLEKRRVEFFVDFYRRRMWSRVWRWTLFLSFAEESRLRRVFLFIFEGLGTSELFMILIVALVLFGPRKLPQLSRSLGKSLANFKRASEDFKQTWEKEVAREGAIKEALIGEAMLPDEDRSILGESRSRTQAVLAASEEEASNAAAAASHQSSATIDDSNAATSTTAPAAQLDAPEIAPTRKRDWL